MRELVRLTNAVAARMIISALSGGGGFDAFLADARVSATTAADAASRSAAQASPTAKSAAKAFLPAHDRSREHHSARKLLAAI